MINELNTAPVQGHAALFMTVPASTVRAERQHPLMDVKYVNKHGVVVTQH